MTIIEMQDSVINRFGFEHPATLYFFETCESFPDDKWLIDIAFSFAMGWQE